MKNYRHLLILLPSKCSGIGSDLDALEDSVKAMLKEVKCTRWSDAFNTVDRICNDFLDTIPLIVILGLKSM